MNGAKVLIAEDERTTLVRMTRLLKTWGYEPVVAHDGAEALRHYEEQPDIDLVILDWMMPSLDGIEVCKRIRAESSHLFTYILFATAKGESAALVEALDAGANDFFSKPIDPTILKSKLRLAEHVVKLHRDLDLAFRENQAIVHAIPSVLIILDEETRLRRWNARAQNLFALSVREVAMKRFTDIPLGLDKTLISGAIKRCSREGEVIDLHEVEFSVGGRKGWLDLSVTAVRREDCSLQGFLIVGTDISSRREMEIQLRQAQRLETIGQLAAGIAHEINTPAQYVSDNVSFLQESFRDCTQLLSEFRQLEAAVREEQDTSLLLSSLKELQQSIDWDYITEEVPFAFKESKDGLARIAEIVGAMKRFAHPGEEGKQLVDINSSVESASTVCRSEWKYVADLELRLSPELSQVEAFAADINQAILNLIVNAADAIRDRNLRQKRKKGSIVVRTFETEDAVGFSVEDDGLGIPESIRGNIFDPFFTTKEVGKGSGQGLSIVYVSIVEKHSGSIHFETSGAGTTFVVQLPK